MIDLSDEEDPQCIDKLVYYLYNLNYDQRIVDQSANRCYFDVQMCIMADKYDVLPLQLLAEEHFKCEAGKTLWNGELGKAALLAYEYPHVTKTIREHVVNLIIKDDLRAFASKNPGSGIERLMRECADVATDVALAQRTYRDGEERYICRGCAATFIAAIPEHESMESFLCCYCGYCLPGQSWEKCLEEDA